MFFTFLVPLLFLLGLLISYETQTTVGFSSLVLGILGILGSLGGIIIWLWGFISLGSSFSVLPKAKKLKSGGAYQFFRHPIYLGIGLSSLGISVSLGSWFGLAYVLFIVIPLNMIRIKGEEKVLLERFGKKYSDYKQKTI